MRQSIERQTDRKKDRQMGLMYDGKVTYSISGILIPVAQHASFY